jgi:hypothetical protein
MPFSCEGSGRFAATAGLSACTGIPPAGYFATSKTAQAACLAGSYTPIAGYSACLPCPINTYCALFGMTAPLPCAVFSAAIGATACSAPPPAAADYYYNATNFTAPLCPAGSVCPPTASRNRPCAIGTFQPDVGSPATDCSVATDGAYTPFAGSASFMSAPPGYYSAGGQLPVICPAGSFATTAGSTACSICPTGTRCPTVGMTAPLQCLPGTFTATSGSTACTVCNRGYYCPDGANIVVCTYRTYADIADDPFRTRNCDPCPAGYYCPSLTSMIVCPAGSYCPMNTGWTIACPAGTFRSITGGSSLERDCAPCTVGSYCPANSSQPIPCPAGKVQPYASATSAASCVDINPGYIAPTPYTTFACDPGTYQPANGSTVCLPCPYGSYDAATLGRISACPDCPAGGYCLDPTLQSACPGNTLSLAAATSQLGCRCAPGYACTYTKRISAMVSINGSIAAFNANVGGIKTSFIKAIADAAGVLPAQVVIGAVMGGGRRSLVGADVSVKVFGSSALGEIRHSIAVSTSWQPQHSVHTRRVLLI